MHTQENPGRFNIYNFPHKGLRAFMQQTLYTVGSCDWRDAVDTSAALTEVRALMEMMFSHVHHENRFVHTAMEARRPGCTQSIQLEHEEHELAIKAILQEALETESVPGEQRLAKGYQLYTRLALFVAENLKHMVVEETENNAVLWACYTDEEIIGIEQRLVGSMSPQKAAASLRCIVPALNAFERSLLLGNVKHAMPAEAFHCLLSDIRALISEREWGKLAQALGFASNVIPKQAAAIV